MTIMITLFLLEIHIINKYHYNNINNIDDLINSNNINNNTTTININLANNFGNDT